MKGKVLTVLLGFVLGIAASLLWPRFVAPHLPGLGPEMEEVEGAVVRKQRDGERLLLTIDSPRGAALVTFDARVPEIDLLVEEGDAVTLALRGYQPFLADPEIRGVRKSGRPVVGAGAGEVPAVPAPEPVAEEPAAPEPAAPEPAAPEPAADPPPAELEEFPGSEAPG